LKVACRNCGVETSNKKFCSNSCSSKWNIANGVRRISPKFTVKGLKDPAGNKQRLTNKTLEEIHGFEKALKIKQSISKSVKNGYAEGRRKTSPLCINWKNPELRRKRISETRKRKIANGEIILNPVQFFQKGKRRSVNTEFKKGHKGFGGGAPKGTVHSEESKIKHSESMIKLFEEHPEERIKRSKAMKEKWESPGYSKKILHRRSVSGPEKDFQNNYVNKYGLSYFYNGNLSNREVVISGKTPDFVHNTENKFIEIWGDFYHRGQNPQDRIDFFRERGYDCLVLWASELSKEDTTIKKIVEFEIR